MNRRWKGGFEGCQNSLVQTLCEVHTVSAFDGRFRGWFCVPGGSPGPLGIQTETAKNQEPRNKMQTLQERLPLTRERRPGESSFHHRIEVRLWNTEADGSVSRQERLASLLKTSAREAMRAVTECAPPHVPFAVARVLDLDRVIAAVLELGLVEQGECFPTDCNPCHAHTLADYRAALEFTRNNARGPAWVSRWHGELSEIRNALGQLDAKLDLLASLIGNAQRGQS